MDRQEILLKEYEICQKDSSAMISAQWTVVGIFMTINTALLGWILKDIISAGIILENFKGLVLAFGVGIILIIILLWQLLERVSFLVRINNNRMEIIETQLGIWKNRLVGIYDKRWVDIPKEYKEIFRCPKRKLGCLHGIWFARLICILLALFWIFFILIAYCPTVSNFILN